MTLIEKIVAQLKDKFKGERSDALEQLGQVIALTEQEEEGINKAIEALTPEKVKEFTTNYGSTIDKKVTDATKTFEGNLKKKYKFVEIDKTADTGPIDESKSKGTDPSDQEPPAWAKALIDNNKMLNDQLETIQREKTIKSRKQQIKETLKEAPKTYQDQILNNFDRMSFESEDEYNNYLNETKENVSNLQQELANKGLSQQSKPVFGDENEKGVSQGVNSYIEQKIQTEKNEGVFAGREV